MDAVHKVVRHPLRGALAGLFVGLGLALLLFSFSVIALGTLAPLMVVLLGLVVGVLVGTVVPPRGRHDAPTTPPAATPQPPATTPPAG